jgi:hypothetical protein
MATTQLTARATTQLGATILLRTLAVGLTLATAAIHASLGGALFMANAFGYTVLAIALIVPGAGSIRWLIRVGLLGFTAATIAGWVLFGARFPLAYADKAIEVVLIGVLAIDIWRLDGGPLGVARRARRLFADAIRIGTGTMGR